MKNIEKVALITLVVEIIVIGLCISLNVLKSPSCLKLERITKSLSNHCIDPKYEQDAADYIKNMDDSFQTKFMERVTLKNRLSHTTLRPKTGELSTFGIELLSMYQLDNKKTDYLTIVEYFITKMDKLLGNSISDEKIVPWDDNWYDYSVTFNRMLAMYEYIGKKNAIKDICNRRILQITPNFNHSLGWKREGVNIAYLAIPRLLTNYMFNRERYDLEVKSELFIKLDAVMNSNFNPGDDLKDGLYQDYSCICHTDVPSFSYLSTLGEFYVNTYKALGFKSDISSSIIKIFDKLLHPKLNFTHYGLFGRGPKITCIWTLKTYWPDYKKNPNFDVNIFPFIGLGVFKSKKFVFSVRVQRDKIAAYESDKDNQQFALGWIQMRKLYHVEIDYSKYKNDAIKWEELKLQPGVVSFAKDEDNKFDAFRPMKLNDTPKSYCEDIKSFIGHLKNPKDKKLLYWFNKYKFKAFYEDEVEILEVGVCTDNGLVMRYEIKNQSGKNLKLILKDKDIGNKMSIKPLVDDSGAGILINNSTSPVTVNWYQLFDATIEPKTVDWNDTNNSVSFTFDDESYLIEQHNNYHIVKCNDRIILAGNPSSLRKGSITHTDSSSGKVTVFERDPNTLMYVPQQS